MASGVRAVPLQEVRRVCEEERRSSKSFMRRVKALEEEIRCVHLKSNVSRTSSKFV